MIAVRISPAGMQYAGLAAWEGDGEATVPVVSARPAYSREDAEREGWLLPEHPTDSDRELASLRRVRRMVRSMSEASWRRFLRESDYAAWAELEEWSEPQRPGPGDGVPIDLAEWLVAEGLAEFVEADSDELEAELARLLDERPRE